MKNSNNECPSHFVDIDQVNSQLIEMFPGMSNSIQKKHFAFVELLGMYEWSSIHWIEDFLEEKQYEYKGIKYLNWDTPKIDANTIDKVKSWDYVVWIKSFYEKTEEKYQIDNYLIIAKKKNSPMLDKLKEWVSNLVNKSLSFNN